MIICNGSREISPQLCASRSIRVAQSKANIKKKACLLAFAERLLFRGMFVCSSLEILDKLLLTNVLASFSLLPHR